jgi:predicted metal-dependent hydrolase
VVTGIPEGEAATGLPAFTVRTNDRARHVRLVVTGGGELIVVVPRRFDRRAIPAVLEAKRSWIERARARMAARPAPGAGAAALPDHIALPALGEAWKVEYRSKPGGPGAPIRRVAVAREAGDDRLVVSGPAGDEDAYSRALIAWLRRRGRNTLIARLEELAPRHGFTFERATVRNQRTRWGSCSRRGTISLNLRLLFLDPVLVDHVLLHELCHTRELNHSKRFWALMQAHDPDCALHRRQARDAWRSLPSWIDGRRAGPLV